MDDGVVYPYTSHAEDDTPPRQGQLSMRDRKCYSSTDMVMGVATNTYRQLEKGDPTVPWGHMIGSDGKKHRPTNRSDAFVGHKK